MPYFFVNEVIYKIFIIYKYYKNLKVKLILLDLMFLIIKLIENIDFNINIFAKIISIFFYFFFNLF